MRLFNLFLGHLLDHLFLTDRRIRVAANGTQDIPHIGACQIRSGHSQPHLIVPANAGLGTRMPLHRRPQVPFKGALWVAFHTKAQRIHHANQLFGIGISRPRRRPKFGPRLGKLSRLHQIARLFNVCTRRTDDQKNRKNNRGKYLHLISLLAAITGAQGLGAQTLPAPIGPSDFPIINPDQAKLGQLLFYDKILSGNQNISCGTCHNGDLAGADALSLGIGEGGVGVGTQRRPGSGASKIAKRIPRNAPALWNLGHGDVSVMFFDGRIERSDIYGNGFNTPAEEWLPQGLNSLLAAQALFPLTAQFEMAGNTAENEIAGAINDRIDAAWPILAKRVRVIPEYGALFVRAFPGVQAPQDVTITQIANALAAFIQAEWQSYDSPFDDFLAGNPDALNTRQKSGMALFYGRAKCAACHSGSLFTDQNFYALGLPAFGPGRTRAFDPYARDVGRMGKSDRSEDAYRFRTPPLRNVALTAPYGHNGAYPDLAGIIAHHGDPRKAAANWKPAMAQLVNIPWLAGTDFVIRDDAREMARQNARLDIQPVTLSDADIQDLTAFLGALTGKTAITGRPFGIPRTVPSGLSVDRVTKP